VGPGAKSYYWHRLSIINQPDLNFATTPPCTEHSSTQLDSGWRWAVDGMRLDAVPYLSSARGRAAKNLPDDDASQDLARAAVEERFKNRMLLAEANQWPRTPPSISEGRRRRLHMAFHFPVMPRMFMAIKMEDRFPLLVHLEPDPGHSPKAQWALFPAPPTS